MARTSRRTDRFVTRGDDGRPYTVEHWTDVIDAEAGGGPATPVDGRSWFRTPDGRAIALRADGRYQIVGSSIILTPVRARREAPGAGGGPSP